LWLKEDRKIKDGKEKFASSFFVFHISFQRLIFAPSLLSGHLVHNFFTVDMKNSANRTLPSLLHYFRPRSLNVEK